MNTTKHEVILNSTLLCASNVDTVAPQAHIDLQLWVPFSTYYTGACPSFILHLKFPYHLFWVNRQRSASNVLKSPTETESIS